MRTLQGIIRQTAVNSIHQYDKIAYYSQNMSNFNTDSYKAVHFEDVLKETGLVDGYERRDFSQGLLRRVDSPLSVAIDGAGFIPVTNKDGEILYTRDGSFTTDKEGTIVTYKGDIVGPGINIGANYHHIEIKKNGEIYTHKTATDKGEYKGTIPVVTFSNPEKLKPVGGNNYAKTEESGNPELEDSNHQKISQYFIESSNVDLFNEVISSTRTNTSLFASTTLISTIDKMYEKAINIRE